MSGKVVYAHSTAGPVLRFATFKAAQAGIGITYELLKRAVDKPVRVRGWRFTRRHDGESTPGGSVAAVAEAAAAAPAPDELEIIVAAPSGFEIADPDDIGGRMLKCLRGSDGNAITTMRADGYLMATSMCKAFGKRWNDFFNLNGTQLFIKALSRNARVPEHTSEGNLGLVDAAHGGNTEHGTWVHPDVAIKLAAWLSVDFEVAVCELVRKFLRGEVTTQQSQNAAAAVAASISVGLPVEMQLATDDDKKMFVSDWMSERRAEAAVKKRKRDLEVIKEGHDLMQSIGDLDERDIIAFKDLVRTALTATGIGALQDAIVVAVADPGPHVPTPQCPSSVRGAEISMHTVAAEAGVRIGERAGAVGKRIRALYRAKYGDDAAQGIPKRSTFFRGKPFSENTYFMRDKDLITTAIREVCGA
ncbi:KilA-N domain-containing protein [Tribonema minus]|uniref:KilA-N domain-containing protein n=1 Tax=Tribonema minus TaxID=303371 RepID=A0A836CFR2_9STRA|nr:KilA-N domain-containing protein [Tribonema minus]